MGIAVTITLTGISLCFGGVRKWLKSLIYSAYSGVWYDEIYDIQLFETKQKKKVIKRDKVVIRHRKRSNKVTGTIERCYPKKQDQRKWKFSGILHNQTLVFTFWSEGVIKSHGCVYVRLTEDNVFEGYYLEDHGGVIDKTPIKLSRVEVTSDK